MIKQIKYFFYDWKRWEVKSLRDLVYLFFELGFWATFLFRLSRMFCSVKIPVIKLVFGLISCFINLFSEIVFGVRIPGSVDIGPGLYIGHVGNIIIHHTARIGSNCSIGQGVSIGVRGQGKGDIGPTIGDDVYIGVGAKILGQIAINNGTWVGANSVVLQDTPINSTVVGIPSTVKRIRDDK